MIRRMKDRADLIAVLHGGALTGSSNRLYTREFFAACGARLAEGGTLALDLSGTANVAAPEEGLMRASIYAALQEEFRDVRIAPGETHYLFAALPNARGAGEPSPLSWSADTLAARRARLWPTAAPWPIGAFAALFPPERVRSLQAAVERRISEGVAPNRDSRPLVYYEQIRQWDRLSGSGLSELLAAWHDEPWIGSLLLLAVLGVLASLARRRYGQPVVSLAGTGMAGMGTSLLLLLLFQTYRGTLYLKVGLLTALFMTGLALGAWVGTRLVGRGAGRRGVGASDCLWVLFLILLIALIGIMPRLPGSACEGLLLGLALAAGILTALPFPWVAESLGASSTDPASAGGIADAADHAGAVCGALLTGTFLVPLLGFSGSLLFLAGVKILNALGALWVPGKAGR
jgi:spermidine synthase